MSTNHTSPAPTSDIPHPTSLSQPDRNRLTILYRARGDATSLISLCGEDNPLDILAWLNEPHIKPWHQAICAAHNQHLHTDTQLSLARALKDITRILDLEADSTLRIRAVTNIIRLANAIHRASPSRREGQGWVRSAPDNPRPDTKPDDPSDLAPNRKSKTENRKSHELHFAQERVEDSKSSLSLHLDRRARNKTDLEDTTAPVGAIPSWARASLPAEGRAGVGLDEIPSTPPPSNPKSKIENPESMIESPRAPCQLSHRWGPFPSPRVFCHNQRPQKGC